MLQYIHHIGSTEGTFENLCPPHSSGGPFFLFDKNSGKFRALLYFRYHMTMGYFFSSEFVPFNSNQSPDERRAWAAVRETLFLCIYIYVYIFMYIFMCIYIHIQPAQPSTWWARLIRSLLRLIRSLLRLIRSLFVQPCTWWARRLLRESWRRKLGAYRLIRSLLRLIRSLLRLSPRNLAPGEPVDV